MANRLQNKSSFDVAADSDSLESLSFAGFICIEDQKLIKSSPTNSPQVLHKQDSEFEFSQAKQESTTTDTSKYSPADVLISNGKLLPQAFLIQSKTNKPHRKGSSPVAFTGSETSSDRTGAKEVSVKKIQDEKKQSTSSRSGFGWKLLKSFASPCRECKAATPVKTQTIPRESLKIH